MGDGSCLPSDLSRQALFMTFANLGQRCYQFIESDIWVHVVKLVDQGQFGFPYETWTLLDRICYSWMRSLETQHLDMTDIRWAERSDLIKALEGQAPRDFVQLLEYQQMKKFIEQEATSVILGMSGSNWSRMTIMRTKKGRPRPSC
jgi:hypothetical protein